MVLNSKEALIADQSEKSRQFIHHAIELALSFGDFQQQIDSLCSPQAILQESAKRVEQLVTFDFSAFYLVDEESSDFFPTLFRPADSRCDSEQEIAFMIHNGYLAWAIRERRGITVFSKDGRRRILLHVLATYSRVLGVFIGFFPVNIKGLPDASLEILSLILRNTANGLESLTCYGLLQQQNDALEEKVAFKTERLLRYERQLMEAQKTQAIMALSGGIAHQFNNVLTGLIGNIDLLEMSCSDHPEVEQFVRQAHSVCERMTNLTRQLLAYVQGGQFKPVTVSVNELLSGVFPVLRRVVRPTIELITEKSRQDYKIEVDVTQMQMALSTIVINADEAIAEKGWIRVAVFDPTADDSWQAHDDPPPPGHWLGLSVQDSGQGMEPDTLRRIFEPFFTTKFEGRGLGMAMVSGIVKNHQGIIRINSRVNEGTCVAIYLPLVE